MWLHAAIIVGVLGGCYGPSYQDCVIECGGSGICPTGYQCNTDGYCRLAGMTERCFAIDASIDAAYPTGPFGPPVVSLVVAQTNVDDPSLTADQLEMMVTFGGDLYVVTRPQIGMPWGMPVAVADLNTAASENGVEMTPDGLSAVFARSADLHMATRSSRMSPWGMVSAIAELNSPQQEGSPSLSADGLTIVFDSDRGTNTGRDIFISTRTSVTASWPAPQPILAAPVHEDSPHLSSDGLQLFFHSAPIGSTNFELVVAQRPAVGMPFGMPMPLATLNSNVEDEDPWVSPDGHTIYFMSSRDSPTGHGAIFEAHR